jgi:glyoxylase-like metal-dependent hydrolase (beta-lactamase superfamily II)
LFLVEQIPKRKTINTMKTSIESSLQINESNMDFSQPIEIAPDIFWVGIYLENDPFQCHPYLILNKDETILVDPGSMLQLDRIIEKIKMASDLKDIKYIILQHQDPDLCAAVPTIEKLIDREDLLIVTHSRMSVLVKHYGIQAGYYNIDHNNFILKTKYRDFHFYTTPYCHSPGAFVTYDEKTKVLFSSDIFGGLEDSWQFYADEEYFSQIEGFHLAYMPSRDILNYALSKIEALDINLIAPQHGSIIRKELIKPLIDKMKQMNCGLYIDKKYSNDLQRTIEKLNNLQTEFTVSLDEIKNLKRRQDGDYFLTSLLMKPLLVDFNKSETVTTNHVIIQKKTFLFKDKQYQLGGDLCISGNLIFDNNPWTLFFNGDAMGKSVQGAGGAVVMGTVLNSILARSGGCNITHVAPEKWLKDAYNEIQTIFISFDGAMMVSGIIGLINDNTGEMFFINAEHPFLILYRAGKATFIENELTLRKFGSPSEFEFKMQKFQLEPGDMVYAGSDGKDDIDLVPGTDLSEINQDSTLILKIIEKSKGNLKKIITEIYKAGDVIDDLSLCCIGFKEKTGIMNQKESLSEDTIYWIQISNYIKNKNYQKALDLLEGPSEKQSPETLFSRGYCFIKERRYLKSLKYLTRAIKKKPKFFHALKYAGIAHYKLDNLKRCKTYWQQALELKQDDRLINTYYPDVIIRLEKQKVLLGQKQQVEEI